MTFWGILMSNVHHLQLLRGGVRGWNAWRADAQGIRPDLSSSDLSGANLAGMDLSRASLSGADLRGALLAGTILRSGNLAGANLDGADLSGADLTEANLAGASLLHANLSGARLNNTNLAGANMSGGLNLSGAKLERANLAGADLRGGLLYGTGLESANLAGADLRGVLAAGASLGNASLAGAQVDDDWMVSSERASGAAVIPFDAEPPESPYEEAAAAFAPLPEVVDEDIPELPVPPQNHVPPENHVTDEDHVDEQDAAALFGAADMDVLPSDPVIQSEQDDDSEIEYVDEAEALGSLQVDDSLLTDAIESAPALEPVVEEESAEIAVEDDSENGFASASDAMVALAEKLDSDLDGDLPLPPEDVSMSQSLEKVQALMQQLADDDDDEVQADAEIALDLTQDLDLDLDLELDQDILEPDFEPEPDPELGNALSDSDDDDDVVVDDSADDRIFAYTTKEMAILALYSPQIGKKTLADRNALLDLMVHYNRSFFPATVRIPMTLSRNALLAGFDDPSDALRCASLYIDMLRGMQVESYVAVNMGIGTIRSPEDEEGHDELIANSIAPAARLMPVGTQGEVLVLDELYNHAGTQKDMFAFEPVERMWKAVSAPNDEGIQVTCYMVKPKDGAVPTSKRRSKK